VEERQTLPWFGGGPTISKSLGKARGKPVLSKKKGKREKKGGHKNKRITIDCTQVAKHIHPTQAWHRPRQPPQSQQYKERKGVGQKSTRITVEGGFCPTTGLYQEGKESTVRGKTPTRTDGIRVGKSTRFIELEETGPKAIIVRDLKRGQAVNFGPEKG